MCGGGLVLAVFNDVGNVNTVGVSLDMAMVSGLSGEVAVAVVRGLDGEGLVIEITMMDGDFSATANAEGLPEFVLVEVVEGDGVVGLGGAGIVSQWAGVIFANTGVDDDAFAVDVPFEGECIAMAMRGEVSGGDMAGIEEEVVIIGSQAEVAGVGQVDMGVGVDFSFCE